MLRNMTSVLALLLVLCESGVWAQVSNDTIKIDTRLVSVPVVVSDRNGRYIPNLSVNEFSILQDGVSQKIEFFGATEEPLTIALLIDTSQSTRPVLDDIKDSARSLIKLLSPHDKAMIVAFDYTTHFLCPLTSNQDELRQAIKRAEIPRGLVGTTLRDAAFQTIDRVFRPIKGRKAVIVLTDGKDVGSHISPDELVFSLEESDTLVYSVMFKTDERAMLGRRGGILGGRSARGGNFPFPRFPDDSQRSVRIAQMNQSAEETLRKMSEATAGRFFSSKDGKLKDTFASIIDELRFQYRLGFYPSEENGENDFHTIKVKVSRAESVVRARNGYRGGSK